MTTLARFEARKVLRNPLLWLGAALLFAFGVGNAVSYWPSIPADGEYVHEGLVVLAPFALLVGALLGLRDRTSRAESVLASTPLVARGLVVPARMAALALASVGVCALVFAATALTSFARGGHGYPDVFFVLDAGLYVALAACGGFAIGYVSGSRILSLLAAPILPGMVFYRQGSQSGSIADPSWLLPSPRLPGRFGPLGYLPDIFPVHALYLAGGILALIGIVWVRAGRRESSSAARPGLVATVAGSVVFLAAGGWLAVQPREVHVFGPEPADWVEIHTEADYRRLGRARRDASPDAGRVLATACVETGGIGACVFPEYGTRLAIALAENAAPLAEFASLDGVPQSIRMVPTADHTGIEDCAQGDDLLVGSQRWSVEFQEYEPVAERGFYCAVYGRRQLVNPAANALHAWFAARVTRDHTGREFVRAVRQGWGRRAAEAVGHLADVPVADVVDRLEPIWDDVRTRDASLADLRRALGAPG
ncbi:MAG TPA: hypothetical protein VHN37_16160 [Actinomycetota bacterium]|nr:hypothetical protein [Actinomycetota bacterium]